MKPCSGCAKRRDQIKTWLNRQRGRMPDVGLKGNPPIVRVERASMDQKRQVEFYVNDISSTLGRLNAQLAKCARVNVSVTLGLETVDGVQRVVLVSAVLP